MKFSQSERTLHQEQQFTPPCNYYEPHVGPAKVLTGSLAGPAYVREQAHFGLSSRFNQTTARIPGPGSYFAEKIDEKLPPAIQNSAKIRQYKRQGVLSLQQNSPSIPYNQFKLDEQDIEYVKELLLSEDLNKSALALKKRNEGYTFSKAKKVNEKKEVNNNNEMPLDIVSEYPQRPEQQFKIQQMKEKVKRANEKRAEIINMINPEFVPSLQLIELITKRRTKYTPGPGAYNNQNESGFKSIQQGKSFSSAKRFSEDKKIQLGPGEYEYTERKKQSVSFSKSQRNLFNMKAETDLEHRFYIDPFTTINKREVQSVKSQNQNHPFGSQVTRFSKLQKEPSKMEQSYKSKKASKLEQVVEKRLKMINSQKSRTKQSQGLLGLSTMASTID